ncbi:MAG: thioredoxin [Firmicutes bacterium HGW-Firmicutes-19]|nr:MAG: thioredoxin [Firmicutes bacterium HGW-Firmicutes-19]
MKIIKINEDNFIQEVLQSDRPVIVDFYADWCGPCKMVSPVLEEIAYQQNEIKIAKLDVDAYPALAQQFGVNSIPTIIAFKGGQEYKRRVGFANKQILLDLVR